VITLTVQNGNLAGRRFTLDRELTLGRTEGDLLLEAGLVSRRHAVIRPSDRGAEVADLGSTNGTWVNGARIASPTTLRGGDVVALGGILIVVDAEQQATVVSRRSWDSRSEGGVNVHAASGSYAARRAPGELAEAVRTVARLQDLLAPGQTDAVDIFLTDEVAGGGRPPAVHDAIVRVLSPDAPDEPLAYALAPLLVGRWYGAQAADQGVLVTGIAGVVTGAPAADDHIRARLSAGERVSILGSPDAALATSFVAFLLRRNGPDALRRAFADFDPERRDHAVTAAFGRPLGALEELWLLDVRGPVGFRATLRALLGQLAPLMRPHRRRWIEVVVYILAGVLYTLAIPLAFKYLFDTVIPDASLSRLAGLAGVLLAIYLTNVVVTLRRSYVTALITQSVLFELQGRMFERLQWLSHDFYGRAKVGDLMSRLTQDLNVVQSAITSVFSDGVFLVASAAAAAVIAIVLSPPLGLSVLVVVPVFALSYKLLLTRIRAAGAEVGAAHGQVAASLQEGLSAHSVVKAFSLERSVIDSYRGQLAGLLKAVLRIVLLSSLFGASVTFAVALGELVVISLGGYLVIEKDLSLGTLVAFIGLLPLFFQPVTTLGNVGQEVNEAAGAMERILEVLGAPISIAETADAVALAPLAHAIRLEAVSFGYERDQPVLDALDMEIPAGRHVAIVGRSGSGKSTIVNLLMRFWDPDGGRILIDGQDIRAATLASLRGQIGTVFQDTFVFDTTVRGNIALGRRGATDEDVLAAARAAQLEEWIATLPGGIDSVLGERGARMSGGQRQRLAIARALIRDPSILILDEATSALDAETEREVLDILEVAGSARTVVSITHRLSVAARSDYVFVLENGALVAQGTHRELVTAGGLYQRLHEEQTAQLRGDAAQVKFLQAVPLFADLSAQELRSVAGRLVFERHQAGEQLVAAGELARKLYIVARGELETVTPDGSRAAKLRPGDYFGELALLADEPQRAAVRTTVPSELYSLERADLASLLERDGDAQVALASQLVDRRHAQSEAVLAATRAGAMPTV
jgi:ABC-type multidrug transport system fused ATPase/permease subunit